ncbi:hypothetical protein SH580_03015 [Coraliomargarita algicola]|uniref:Lipoprotein n=1 Tax=Coraliomargarita algicola TaxID=3092156 RepID=A0ABZ0RNI4_9BACT|nr:hypothetical protein [Coraliomargarita sp. J2-16]WPJ96673.1 hypothetical protein SH580_03015 [Coraliomargarita sp. J2-16]
MKFLVFILIIAAGVGFCWKNDLYSLDDIQAYFKQEQAPPPVEKKASPTYHDAESAFKQDQLFAVLSKDFIPSKTFDKTFQKTALGGQAKGSYPPVYTIKCLGRETRETYIFVVGYRFYNKLMINEKLQPSQLGSYRKYLSEEDFRNDLFNERYQFKMID